MSPAHTKQHRDSHPHRDSLPAQSLPGGSGVGGAPLALCICICVRGSLVAVCVAVLACVLAGNTESALIMSNCWAPGQDGAQLCVYSYKRTMYVVWYGRT